MVRNKFIPIITAVSSVILGIIVGIIVTLFLTLFNNYDNYDKYDKNDFIDPDTYQSVFLINDQIYFGHLKNISSDYLILSDVYYVKIGEDSAGQLVKLGQMEPHKPKDEMVINKNHILFWENLNSDSPVVQTIQGYKK